MSIMEEPLEDQVSVCKRIGSPIVPLDPLMKIGIALSSIGSEPLNALRHPPDGNTSGWYIWGGTELSVEPGFFEPLHASHLADYAPALVPYMALAPGWRVLLAPGYEDVWFDASLMHVAD